MTTTNDIRGTFQTAEQRHTRAVTSTIAAERATGVTAAQSEIEQLAAAEVARLESMIVAARENSAAAIATIHARAEQTRRDRAAALAAQVFSADKDALPALIHAFRIEPSRQGAVRIRAAWDALNATAAAEIGEPLSDHIIGALVVDDVIADAKNDAAISTFAMSWDFGQDAARNAVYAFTRAQTPPQLQEALAAADTALTGIAARARNGAAPTAYHRDRLAARRACLTTRDLTVAWQEIDQRNAAAELAEFQRTYVPPPTREQFFREQIERLRGAFSG